MTTTVRILKAAAFALDSKELINLIYDDVILVFLDDSSDFSDRVRDVFFEAANKATGPIFASCDIIANDEVPRAFLRAANDLNHPFNWVGTDFHGCILVYRGGWPQAFYNGPIDTDSLVDYSMELASQPSYQEKTNSFKANNTTSSTPAPTQLPQSVTQPKENPPAKPAAKPTLVTASKEPVFNRPNIKRVSTGN